MTLRICPRSFFSVGVVLALALSGCGGKSSSGLITHGDSGVGVTCHSLADCRTGLFCDSVTHTCSPPAPPFRMRPAFFRPNACGLLLHARPAGGRVRAGGTGALGADCSGDGQCGAGLMCAGQG